DLDVDENVGGAPVGSSTNPGTTPEQVAGGCAGGTDCTYDVDVSSTAATGAAYTLGVTFPP
ncbi:MAG: hypothetical protein V3S29_08500, partial [bacterium]